APSCARGATGACTHAIATSHTTRAVERLGFTRDNLRHHPNARKARRLTMLGMAVPRVVILGGGFGGLNAAKALRKAPVQVVMVDRRNHHLFQPLLYQVATAALNPSDIATPIRRVLRHQANVEVILGDATAVDVPGRRVVLRDGAVPYDFLIILTVATHAYFV